MTVDEQITQIYNNAQNMKSVLISKGQTVGDTLSDYSDAITNLPSVVDNVGNTREVSSTGVYQMPSSSFTYSLPSTATDVGTNALRWAFYNCTALTSVDLSSLADVSGSCALNYAFNGCTALASVDLSSLADVSGSYALESAFYNCTALTSVDLSSLADVSGSYALNCAFNGCTALASVDLSSLATVSGSCALNYAFYYCTALASVDLSSLATVSGSYALNRAFNGCTALASVDLSSLATVSGSYALNYAFNGCTALTSIDLSSLTTVSGSYALYYAFYGCTALTSVDLSSLTTVSGSRALNSAFYNCTSLTDVYFRALTTSSFGSYTNQFTNMLSSTGSTVTHTLHFPVDMEDTIKTLLGYPTFGGTSGYVVLSYDLNGATVVFNVTSAGTPTYYISGKEVAQTSMTKLDDTTYVISSTEGVVTELLTGLVQYETTTITKDLTTTSFNTITLATDQEDCTVTFTVNGVTLSPTVTSGSNYTLNLVSSENQTIDYVIKKKGYASTTGTLTYTGSNITENITMTPRTTSIEVNLTPGSTSYGWQATTITNPTSWSMYESTNKGVNSSYAVMKVTFSGYETLTCYINSYAESSFDYTIASTLDASTYPTTYSSTTAYANTRSKQYDPTTFDTSHWTTVTYTPSDTNEHFFYVVFRKNNSSASNNDRGYFIIDEDQ